MWSDTSNLCLQPLEEWIWADIAGVGANISGFYYAHYGVQPGHSREYVENWFIAATRQHPLISAWRSSFCQAWLGQNRCEPVMQGFGDVDLSYIRHGFLRQYLTMHASFKKLIDQDEKMRALWAKMVLWKADDFALGWANGFGDRRDMLRKLVYSRDEGWAENLVVHAHLLKFTGKWSYPLDWQPLSTFS